MSQLISVYVGLLYEEPTVRHVDLFNHLEDCVSLGTWGLSVVDRGVYLDCDLTFAEGQSLLVCLSSFLLEADPLFRVRAA